MIGWLEVFEGKTKWFIGNVHETRHKPKIVVIPLDFEVLQNLKNMIEQMSFF